MTIPLASVITRFESAFLAQYQDRLLPSQFKALKAMQACRSTVSNQMLAQCTGCGEQRLVPHSCGHRSCPHCQHFESQRWIERQTQALLPGNYFLITFTLPQELRGLAWRHQQTVYGLLMQCAWETLAQFSHNHRQLRGQPGAVGVLHTHSRRLEFHPHVHLAMPGAAFDAEHGLWRSLRKSKKGGHYLFSHKALAAVFRGKFVAALNAQGMIVPVCLPERWVVDCKSVGDGHKAVVYLGRYLYRGVIQERDIVRCEDGRVTFRYRDSSTGKNTTRTVSGTHFLWLVLQHVLPKGFRRSRNFGLAHPNCKHHRRLALLRMTCRPGVPGAGTTGMAGTAGTAGTPPSTPPPAHASLSERPKLQCHCCGAAMVIVRRRIPHQAHQAPQASTGATAKPLDTVSTREEQIR
jgi:Putative transposase/Transposase zinc-binding domain